VQPHHTSTPARRIVVLVSGTGTLLQALLDAAPGAGAVTGAAPQWSVVGVVSDRARAAGLDRARAAGVATATVSPADFPDRPSWDEGVARAVEVFSPHLVVLAGFMRILGEPFLRRFGSRTVNTHPALLPAFPGAHGVRDALAYGVKISGATVIIVDSGVDTGPVVAQRSVPVEDGDDERALHERIKVAERQLLVEVVDRMARYGWSLEGRRVRLGATAVGERATAAGRSGADRVLP
jgi:phosphoribosylglycinamide formyltransferase 1